MTETRPLRQAPPRRRGRRCPICRAPSAPVWRPFCSQRCADADLANWLSGNYRIAASEDEADDDGADEDEDGASGR